jgi:hypothetical protein
MGASTVFVTRDTAEDRFEIDVAPWPFAQVMSTGIAIADAVAVRTPSPAAPNPAANADRRELVLVHYTPFAPRLAATPASDPARWAAFSGPTPSQAVRRILDRVEWSAHGVEAIANHQGEVVLYRHRPETSPAIVSQGLTLAEVQAALAQLQRATFA